MSHSVIHGTRILLPPGAIGAATLHCRDGRIETVGPRHSRAAGYDAGDLLVLPGIVDLHGDAFERQIHPRPKVAIPLDVALLETDRQMASNGITTAYHGVTVTWEPGTRDIEAARALLSALDRVKPHLLCDTRVHLRHEILSLDTVDEVSAWVAGGRVDLVAINDHTYMVERAMANPRLLSARLDKLSIPEAEYLTMADHALGRRGEIPESLRRLAAVARTANVPLASHDDATPEMRAWYRELGCVICEFPADATTAEAAVRAGDTVVLGGPNILRGGSHCGRVTAAEMIGAGLCTAICSDYYYPSTLHAPFHLAASGILPFAAAWDLVSRAPALAANLRDRGAIAAGQRADLVLVDDSDPLLPVVRAVFVEGVPVYTANWTGIRVTNQELHGTAQSLHPSRTALLS